MERPVLSSFCVTFIQKVVMETSINACPNGVNQPQFSEVKKLCKYICILFGYI